MKIKRLILTSFGKFQDRTIELSEGFNLIYGQAGAGKTTVQHFIEGIFFGFYRPYCKQGAYAETYEKYRPQNSDCYCGAIILEDDNGRELRIERDFLKAQDGVKIYDTATGGDITGQYPYDMVTHQHQPLGDMKVSAALYNDTVNLRAMAGKTDEDRVEEIETRLVELGAGEDENVALSRVLAYLRNKKQTINGLNQCGVSRDAAEKEMEDLRASLSESDRIFDTIQKNQKMMQQYKKKILMAREKIQASSQRQNSEAYKAVQAVREKAAALEAEGAKLEARLKGLQPSAQIDPRMYGRVKILESNLAGASERMESLKAEIAELEIKCQEITGRCDQVKRSLKGLSRYDVQRDYKQYKAALESPMTEEEFWVDKAEAGAKELVAPSGRTLTMPVIIAAIVIGIFAVGMTLVNPGNVFSGAGWFALAFVGWVLVIGGGAMLWYQHRTADDEASAVVDEIFEDEEIEREMPDVPDAPLTAAAILKKYGRANGEEFERFVHKVEGIFGRLEKLTMEESLFTTQLENKRAELTKVESDAKSFRVDFADELAAAGVEDIDAYAEACENRGEYEKVQSLLEDNRRELAAMGEIPELPADDLEDNPVLMVSSAGGEIRAREAIYAFNEEIKRLRMENDHLYSIATNPVTIRERIEALEGAAARWNRDAMACDRAMAVLERLDGGTKTLDVTALEKRIGGILKEITGRYERAAVDEDFGVRVFDPQRQNFVTIGQLEGETIDQLYFALRFDAQKAPALPLVLDDPFVGCGLERKKAAMAYLWQLGTDRQVMLFTAGGDEKRILDATALDYSGILL